MRMPTAQETWIYYQLLVTFGTLVMAGANVASAIYIYKYGKKIANTIKEVERNTRVMKTDVLLKRVENSKGSREDKDATAAPFKD